MTDSPSRLRLIPILCTIFALLGGFAVDAAAKGGKPYKAEVRWTSFGIPHVRASDWGGLGYGYGYAFARDNVCTLALDVVESTGQLSRFFGPGGGNLQSDAVWALFNSDARTEEGLATLDSDTQALVRGYAAGYNRYLRDTGSSSLPAACRDAEWVRPISEFDVLKVLNKLTLRAGVANFIDPIFGAQPPAAVSAFSRAAPATRIESKADAQRLLEQTELPNWDIEEFGSNAVALGGELTEDGGGALLGNPHFPWFGISRFHAVHLTIPGRYDAMGAAIYGFPLVNIGFNRDVAWSHTVSTARRFAIRELTLAQNDPTSYVYDGDVVPMTTETVTVDVLQPGGLAPVSHTF